MEPLVHFHSAVLLEGSNFSILMLLNIFQYIFYLCIFRNSVEKPVYLIALCDWRRGHRDSGVDPASRSPSGRNRGIQGHAHRRWNPLNAALL